MFKKKVAVENFPEQIVQGIDYNKITSIKKPSKARLSKKVTNA